MNVRLTVGLMCLLVVSPTVSNIIRSGAKEAGQTANGPKAAVSASNTTARENVFSCCLPSNPLCNLTCDRANQHCRVDVTVAVASDELHFGTPKCSSRDDQTADICEEEKKTEAAEEESSVPQMKEEWNEEKTFRCRFPTTEGDATLDPIRNFTKVIADKVERRRARRDSPNLRCVYQFLQDTQEFTKKCAKFNLPKLTSCRRFAGGIFCDCKGMGQTCVVRAKELLSKAEPTGKYCCSVMLSTKPNCSAYNSSDLLPCEGNLSWNAIASENVNRVKDVGDNITTNLMDTKFHLFNSTVQMFCIEDEVTGYLDQCRMIFATNKPTDVTQQIESQFRQSERCCYNPTESNRYQYCPSDHICYLAGVLQSHSQRSGNRTYDESSVKLDGRMCKKLPETQKPNTCSLNMSSKTLECYCQQRVNSAPKGKCNMTAMLWDNLNKNFRFCPLLVTTNELQLKDYLDEDNHKVACGVTAGAQRCLYKESPREEFIRLDGCHKGDILSTPDCRQPTNGDGFYQCQCSPPNCRFTQLRAVVAEKRKKPAKTDSKTWIILGVAILLCGMILAAVIAVVCYFRRLQKLSEETKTQTYGRKTKSGGQGVPSHYLANE